jgi:hypothetical protein
VRADRWCGSQIGSTVESVTRLRLWRYKVTAIAHLDKPAWTKTVDHERREPPFRKAARPPTLMWSDAIAAVKNNDSSARLNTTTRQVKLGRLIAERWPHLGRIKDLRLSRTSWRTKQDEYKERATEFHDPEMIPSTGFDQRFLR